MELLLKILVRFFGILGLILSIIPFQFKKHKQIVLCKMASETSFAVQYFLVGAFTGAWLDLVSGLRNYLYYKFVKIGRSTTPIIIAFGALVVTLGAISWEGPRSLLPVGAKLITTVSYGMKKERLLRLITIPSCILWIIYNLFTGVWEGAVSDSLTLLSILIAIYKFDIRNQKKEEPAAV
ncbi:MAG: YgjV family protein [Clostridia bacterium]|nr:YgjV family protein [Clostridia bacterium]